MKYLLLLFSASLLLSCSPQHESEVQDDQENNKTIQHDAVHTNKSQNKIDSVAWNDLPEKWEMITDLKEEFVRYRPCDAMNPSITIDKHNGSIDLFLGQEGNSFKIVKWKYEERDYKDGYEFYYIFNVIDYYKQEKILTLNYNKGNGVSGWRGVFDSDEMVLFVPERLYSEYREVKEPCRNCFSEEDCDGKE